MSNIIPYYPIISLGFAIDSLNGGLSNRKKNQQNFKATLEDEELSSHLKWGYQWHTNGSGIVPM
jgi:hypothetical protein